MWWSGYAAKSPDGRDLLFSSARRPAGFFLAGSRRRPAVTAARATSTLFDPSRITLPRRGCGDHARRIAGLALDARDRADNVHADQPGGFLGMATALKR